MGVGPTTGARSELGRRWVGLVRGGGGRWSKKEGKKSTQDQVLYLLLHKISQQNMSKQPRWGLSRWDPQPEMVLAVVGDGRRGSQVAVVGRCGGGRRREGDLQFQKNQTNKGKLGAVFLGP